MLLITLCCVSMCMCVCVFASVYIWFKHRLISPSPSPSFFLRYLAMSHYKSLPTTFHYTICLPSFLLYIHILQTQWNSFSSPHMAFHYLVFISTASSMWNSLAPHLCLVFSYLSFRSQHKHEFLQEGFPKQAQALKNQVPLLCSFIAFCPSSIVVRIHIWWTTA